MFDLNLLLVLRTLLLPATERICHQSRPRRDRGIPRARSCRLTNLACSCVTHPQTMLPSRSGPHSDKTSCAGGAPPCMKMGLASCRDVNLLFSVEVGAIFIAAIDWAPPRQGRRKVSGPATGRRNNLAATFLEFDLSRLGQFLSRGISAIPPCCDCAVSGS
jgi:hypothetical protein